MTAVLLALFTASVLGVSDFLAGLAGRRAAAIQLVLVSYTVSLCLLLVLAPLAGGALTVAGAGWGLAMGVVEGLAMWWFYQALAIGPISIVSLGTALLAGGVPVCVGIAAGERPSALAAGGVTAGLGAVVLLARGAAKPDAGSAHLGRRVIILTLGAGTAFSGVAICLHNLPGESGLWPLVLARIPALVIFALVAAALAELRAPRGMPLRVALLLGILNVAAIWAALRAYQSSLLSLISVVTALYPVTTILLALTLLHERVTRWQRIGLVLALLAVALIVLGEGPTTG